MSHVYEILNTLVDRATLPLPTVLQFIKAMRDERGEMLPNAHLIGFFRRICKLLYHRIRPVFVFDGATPILKKRTTWARRKNQEQHAERYKKAAEKLLYAQMKKRALEQVKREQEAAVAAKRARVANRGESPVLGRDEQDLVSGERSRLREDHLTAALLALTDDDGEDVMINNINEQVLQAEEAAKKLPRLGRKRRPTQEDRRERAISQLLQARQSGHGPVRKDYLGANEEQNDDDDDGEDDVDIVGEAYQDEVNATSGYIWCKIYRYF